uniref:Glutathione S-transferase epsilon3 n=1 Tax=Micromelalopha troglodyta TaxID=660574 RepID=A0A509ZL34_9NEOP|nr:glutathione S-transferase epsilon3 [Micromelalopha troglodyta]
MSLLVLHRAFGSPPARAVLMCCHTLALDVRIREVNIIEGDHLTPQFRKLNPMATVPVIEDGDFVLSESHAIMKYLVRAYGGDKKDLLYPPALRTRAIVDQCMFFDAGVLFKAAITVLRGALLGGLSGLTKQNLAEIEAAYGVMEAYLQTRPYMAADWMTLAGYSTGSTTFALHGIHQVDSEKYPRCADWLTRLGQEQIFKEINAPGVAFLVKLLHKIWENNKAKNKTL